MGRQDTWIDSSTKTVYNGEGMMPQSKICSKHLAYIKILILKKKFFLILRVALWYRYCYYNPCFTDEEIETQIK